MVNMSLSDILDNFAFKGKSIKIELRGIPNQDGSEKYDFTFMTLSDEAAKEVLLALEKARSYTTNQSGNLLGAIRSTEPAQTNFFYEQYLNRVADAMNPALGQGPVELEYRPRILHHDGPRLGNVWAMNDLQYHYTFYEPVNVTNGQVVQVSIEEDGTARAVVLPDPPVDITTTE